MASGAADQTLDDIQVLGMWNFTLQGDTPLYWLRTGQLDRYLLKYRMSTPSPCTTGMVIHAEVDGPGTDGVSFWVDRRPGKDGREGSRRYMLAGEGLDSSPIVTRSFPDPGGELTEEVELLMEGYSGTVLLQDRKVSLRFRLKLGKGSIAFYNSTQGDNDDVHFSGVRITAMRRGPLEVDGKFLQRERNLERFDREGKLSAGEERATATEASPAAASSSSPMKRKPFAAATGGTADSRASTMVPEYSLSPQTRSTLTAGVSTFGGRSVSNFGTGGSSMALPSATSSLQHQLPSPTGSAAAARSPMQLGGRGAGGGSGYGGGTGPRKLQFSASDGALRKTGGSLFGATGGAGGASSTLRPRQGKGSGKWVPLAVNAPAGEQALLKTISRKPKQSSNACNDFIAM